MDFKQADKVSIVDFFSKNIKNIDVNQDFIILKEWWFKRPNGNKWIHKANIKGIKTGETKIIDCSLLRKSVNTELNDNIDYSAF